MSLETICFINQKGGCGKSSCCFHLGGCLTESGYRVLLVDADPQGSLSQAFFGSQHVEWLESHETLASLFDDNLAYSRCASRLARQTAWQNLFLVCANQTLAPHNGPCPEQAGLRQYAVVQYLEVAGDFDFALLDCPPNLYQCSWNALLAADHVIVPVPPEDFGAQGLRAVHQAIQHATLLNPRLQLLGHLVTRYDRRLLVHRAYESRLRELYGAGVLETIIPEASAFKVALTCRQPVCYCAPRSRATLATRQLTEEILQRIVASKNAPSEKPDVQYTPHT